MEALPEHTPRYDRRLGVRLRPYQTDLLEVFRKGRAEGAQRFHFVAPPGAGKTVLGLALMLEEGARSLVFSPNAAIQRQWVQRFEGLTVALPSPGELPLSMGQSPRDPDPWLSLTYQSVTLPHPEGGLHPNAREALENFREAGVRVLVFDECHHLTGHWGEVLTEFAESLEDAVVIGLTATPPVDSRESQMQTYLDLVGPIDQEIPLPAIVREGNLAPYQDLVYFTRPEEGEMVELFEVEGEFRRLFDRLEDLELPLVPLSVFLERSLAESKPLGVLTPFDEWLQKDPDQAIAYVRYLRYRGVPAPASVLWMDEMESSPELVDLIRILQDFLGTSLEPKLGLEAPLVQEVLGVLDGLGFRYRQRAFHATNRGAAGRLRFSRSKLEGMRRILRHEQAHRPQELRALVLCDYEKGRADQAGYTALDVMEVLTQDPDLDELDPILITGKSLLVDDDVTEDFLVRLRGWIERDGAEAEVWAEEEGQACRILGRGRDWNTRHIVGWVTEALETGFTRCLVGTRALLGEGWDAQSLDTLVDLTVVSTFVSVNQIRGRTIRKDPDRPEKCANNWDVVTVLPGVGYGLYDFERLEKKHSQFYGVSEDRVIEKGLGHVHPWLSKGEHERILAHLDELNQEMLDRSRARSEAGDRWQVGSGYQGIDGHCLELAWMPEPGAGPKLLGPGGSGPPPAEIEAGYRPLEEPETSEEELSHPPALVTQNQVRALEDAAEWIEKGVETRRALLGYWFLFLPVVAAGLHWFYQRWRGPRAFFSSTEADLEAEIHTLGQAVLEGLQKGELFEKSYGPEDIHVSLRVQGSLRVYLEGAGAQDSKRFTEALYEVLGPIQDHRYLLERRGPQGGIRDWFRRLRKGQEVELAVLSCHPVPSILGRNRSLAEGFRESWNQHVAPGELCYTRSEAGRDMVREWIGRRPFGLRRQSKKFFQ